MGRLDQFAKDTFAAEAPAITHGAVAWQLPPELGMSEVRLDGLLRILDPAALAVLPPPWCAAGQENEVVLEIKMPGDHVDLLAIDRAHLRRLARQVQRREDPNDTFEGEQPLWFVAAHVPAVIRERRLADRIAPGCYRIGPDWLATVWIAANELPLADELVPFLIARTGRPLDEFVRWVVTRRPTPWVLRMLESLPMSSATYDEMRFGAAEPTDDPEVRARQRMILGWFLDALPEERAKLIDQGRLREARKALRRVLQARQVALAAADEARIDACEDLATLERWLDQAATATSIGEALR